jgi:hypothetical protein
VQTPTAWFHCDRDDLLRHFPALRQEPFGRKIWVLDYIRAGPSTAAVVAPVLPHLFRGLERHRVAGAPLELFERADDLLDRTTDSRRGFAAVARFFVGVCCALAKEGGLGCSEAILDQVDEFVVGLLEMREVPLPRPGGGGGGAATVDDCCCRDIVVAYSKVFQPSAPRHMDTLRRVWRLTPSRVRVRISAELVEMCASTVGTTSPQVFFRALRDLSLV